MKWYQVALLSFQSGMLFFCLGMLLNSFSSSRRERARRRANDAERARVNQLSDVYRAMTPADCRQAEEKAKQLLVANLTPQQQIDFAREGRFTVTGGKTGNKYWIGGATVMQFMGGKPSKNLCLVPTTTIPFWDRVLAQKIAFECNEIWALRTAR